MTLVRLQSARLVAARVAPGRKGFCVGVLLAMAMPLFAQLIPGDLTDPTARKTVEAKAFSIPESLHYPYVSTYYVKPTVSPEEAVAVKVFVTDWNNSKVRLGDDSHRFTVTLRLFSGEAPARTFTLRNIPSGDHAFNLGKLPEGAYRLGVFCVDEKKRPSHTVWHVFRVQAARAPKTRTVSLADLARDGIVPEVNRYSYVDVAVTNNEKSAEIGAKVLAEVKARAAEVAPPANGYVVVRPAFGGKPALHGWCRSVVLYGKNYDKAAVAAEAEANTAGFRKLIDASVAAGVARLVLPKDAVFRVDHTGIVIPSNFTLDLNGSTLKMNGFTGAKAKIVELRSAHDAHVVNGVIEGDYYEHDYAGSPNASEWVDGVVMEGDCRYSSFENLVVRNIAGYGGGNGLLEKDHVFPGLFWLTKTFEPGAIDRATGEIVKDAPFRFTTKFHDVSKLTAGWLSVSRFLGYQGLATRQWQYTAAFYDAERKFLSAEVAFQYRPLPIPSGAKFLRVTMTEESLEKMNEHRLAVTLFKLPVNCAFKKVRFARCRAVGLAQSAMRNMLVADCTFTASGETLANCAYDAEDGWDMMQDVYLHRNKFFNCPMNELLTCAGHNFIIEDNDANVHLWGRTLSPCVRNNRGKTGFFYCDNQVRTMHGRYENNVFSKKINFGERSRGEDDWTIVLSGTVGTEKGASLTLGKTGVLRDAVVRDLTLVNPRCENVSLRDCMVRAGQANVTMTDCSLVGCKVENLRHENVFARCSFTGTTITPLIEARSTFLDCAFTNSSLFAGWWTKPSRLLFRNSRVKTENAPFIRTPVYSIDKLLFTDCAFDCGAQSPVEICDLRKNQSDLAGEYEVKTASVAFRNCTTAASGVPLVTAPRNGAKPSEKPLKIFAKGNKAAGGTPAVLIEPALMHTTWKIVE